MVEVIQKLEQSILRISDYVQRSSEDEMLQKRNPEKWSKKEILGHLIDSAIHNLQRFTEIQFTEKPYIIRPYKQNELVIANNYQAAETKALLDLLIATNQRIISVIQLQTEETLQHAIVTPEQATRDLKFLIEDYVIHLVHHQKQITR